MCRSARPSMPRFRCAGGAFGQQMLCFIPLYLRHGELALEILDSRLKVGRATTARR